MNTSSGQCFHLRNVLDESIVRPQIIDMIEKDNPLLGNPFDFAYLFCGSLIVLGVEIHICDFCGYIFSFYCLWQWRRCCEVAGFGT